MPEPKYLERFFCNMLLGEQWVLKNRYLVLNPPTEYSEQPRLDTPASTEQAPVQVPVQVGNQFWTNNENIQRLVKASSRITPPPSPEVSANGEGRWIV